MTTAISAARMPANVLPLPERRAGTRADAPLLARRAAIEAAMPPMPAARLDGRDPEVAWVGQSDRDPVLYLHGGGFRMGSAASSTAFAARLHEATGRPVAVVDYRLAPEHPFPAALNDAHRAYLRLLGSGAAPALLGDSAGGALALGLAAALRDEGLPAPPSICLLSPWVDLTVSADSYRTRARTDRFFSEAAAREAAAGYLAGVEPEHPLASPLRGDLGGLPPVQIHVGAGEVLLDDATALAAALATAGGDVELRVASGVPHVFPVVEPTGLAAVRALAAVAQFIEEAGGAR